MLSSTLESHLPSPPVVRGKVPILQSVSDSGVEWSGRHHHENAFCLTVTDDHQLALAQVSTLLLLDSRTCIRGYCVHMVCSHSPSFSQMKKNDAETSHSRTGSPVRSPSPSHIISSRRTFFDHFSTICRVYSREEPFYPSIPSASPPLSHSTHSRDATARAQQTHGDGDVEEAATLSRSDISCTCACLPLFGSARFHSMHIFVCDMPPRQFYLHVQVRLPSQHFSRVSRRKRLGRDLNFSESSMHANR